MHVVVCYDIVCDRRRGRLFRRMKDFLPRVQKSVFEGEIPDWRLSKLTEMIMSQIDPKEDTVRLYQLCRRCLPSVQVLGTGPHVVESLDDIVI